MNAEIITVGTELLLGDILNSNSQFLSRELAAYGIGMLYQSTVGDNTARLGQVLSLALSRSDLVVLTGGLGPTQDDLTRETVAQTLNLPLELHEESWARIQEYFRNTGREMTKNNQKQAMLPKGAVVFPNDHGTAPGCAVERYGQCVIMLPGPPRELIPMFDDYVAPYLSKFSGGTIFSRTVGVFGLSESAVAQRLADLMCESNPTVAPYAKDGEVVLRVTAKAKDQEAAKALCDPVVEEIRKRLTSNVYGVDAGSLQKAVVTLLKENNLKIATAESCTAGLLSSRITEIPGASQIFECGVAAYSKEIKHDVLGVPQHLLDEHGAVSPEVACAMAMGARRVGKSHLGVGITGVAGPEPSEDKPVGTVYVALADEKRTWVKKIVAGHGDNDREYIRHVATSNALDMIRRYLEALPGVMAGGELIEAPVEENPPVIPAAAPAREKSSKLKIAGIVLAVLLLLAAAGLLVYFYILAPFLNKQLYERVSSMYDKDAGTSEVVSGGGIYPEGMLVQFSTLYSANSDIRGWIHIEDTGINYPVVQSRMEGFYDNHDFYKKGSSYGVPYFSGQADFTNYQYQDRSLVIYGNNTGDGQMFSQLAEYGALEYLQAHPVVEMDTIYRNNKWKIFAVLVVSTLDEQEENFDFTRNIFAGEEDFLQYVQQLRDRSLFDTPTTVEAGDNLLMLTTTASSEYGFPGARIVVAARQVRQDEDETNDLSTAVENEDVVMPRQWETGTDGSSGPRRTTALPVTTPSGASDGKDTATTGSADPTTNATEGTTVEDTTVSSSEEGTTKPTVTTEKTTTTTLPAPPTEPSVPPTEDSSGPSTTPPTDPDPVDPLPDVPDGTVSGTYPEEAYIPLFRVRFGSSRPSGLPIDSDGVCQPTNREELQLALACAVKYEMGTASFSKNSTEAIKAQAVATYSYILNFCKNGAVYENQYVKTSAIDLSNANDKKIYDAVGEVLGVKILDTSKDTMVNQLISTFYSAMSCGVTANSEHYWSSALPWTRSVISQYDNEETVSKYGGTFSQSLTMSKEQFKQQVLAGISSIPGAVMDESQFETADGALPFTVVEYDGVDGGEHRYVYKTSLTYRVGPKTYNITGKQLRAWLVFQVSGSRTAALRSHSFDVVCSGQDLTFTTYGYGHGIGMSQYGAIGLANEAGWSYIDILRHYYSITDNSDHQIVMPVWD